MVPGLPEYGYGTVINSPEGVIWVEEPLWEPSIKSSLSHALLNGEPSITLNSRLRNDQKKRAGVLIENGSQDKRAGKKLKIVQTKDGVIV